MTGYGVGWGNRPVSSVELGAGRVLRAAEGAAARASVVADAAGGIGPAAVAADLDLAGAGLPSRAAECGWPFSGRLVRPRERPGSRPGSPGDRQGGPSRAARCSRWWSEASDLGRL